MTAPPIKLSLENIDGADLLTTRSACLREEILSLIWEDHRVLIPGVWICDLTRCDPRFFGCPEVGDNVQNLSFVQHTAESPHFSASAPCPGCSGINRFKNLAVGVSPKHEFSTCHARRSPCPNALATMASCAFFRKYFRTLRHCLNIRDRNF